MGYQIPFRSALPLSSDPIPFPLNSPPSMRGKALDREVVSLVEKGAVELAPLPSPVFYSQLFLVKKTSGLWRPVINLSTLNLRILKSPFKMETLQSVLLSVQSGDWMVSLDLKDTYLQVPIHPDSRKYLRFVAFGRVYQFKTVFWSLHGSASLHEGHGSGIDFSSSCWDQNSSVFRRLSDPGSLSFFGSSSSGHNAAIVSGLGDCSELGEVESSSFPAHSISRIRRTCLFI